MDIWEANKLLLFIAFFIPGFVSLKAYGMIFPFSNRNAATQLLDAIAYSSINYAILCVPIYLFYNHKNEIYLAGHYAFCLFVLLLAPIIWVFSLKFIRDSAFCQKFLTHPTELPWDYVFQQRKPYWVIVTLKDGMKIAGRYAENSFVSNYPSKEQIYLEETWHLNKYNGFDRPKNDSSGTIVVTSEIAHIELFQYKMVTNE